MNDKFWTAVELFEWEGTLTIREQVSKKTLLTIYRAFCPHGTQLDNREFWFVKKLKEKIAPMIVELMNREIGILSEKLFNELSKSVLDNSGIPDKVSRNGEVVEVKKPRGNPAWVKGMKAPEGAGRPRKT